MLYEVELHFWFGEESEQDPYMALEYIEASCITELSNKAHELAQKQKANYVSFGPSVPRREDGSVDYGKRK